MHWHLKCLIGHTIYCTNNFLYFHNLSISLSIVPYNLTQMLLYCIFSERGSFYFLFSYQFGIYLMCLHSPLLLSCEAHVRDICRFECRYHLESRGFGKVFVKWPLLHWRDVRPFMQLFPLMSMGISGRGLSKHFNF